MFEDVIDRIADYVGNFTSLKNFKAWFYPLAYNVEQRFGAQFADLVNEIDSILAEASSGGWSNAELKSELSAAIAPYRANVPVTTIESSSPPKYLNSLHGLLLRQKLAL